MKALGYAGRLFADLHVTAGFPAGEQPGSPVQAVALERLGERPVYIGAQQGLRTWTIRFAPMKGYPIEKTIVDLLGVLQPGSSEERPFLAELDLESPYGEDQHETQVTALMTVGQPRQGTVNELFIDFYAVDNRWFVLADTVTQVTCTQATALPLLNEGGAVAHPTITVKPTLQRVTQTATCGWKYMRRVTITNNDTEDWWSRPRCIDLGDTAALVTGSKALASGDDLRIRFNGDEYYRTLVNWNTKRTFAWILVNIKAGSSVTYDVVYGNPSATEPIDLSTRTGFLQSYVAFDLEGYNGTATAGAASTLTDGAAAHEVNRWQNGFILITGGTGVGQARRILSNTATVITVNRAWSTNPSGTSTYVIFKSGIFMDGGAVTAKSANTMTDASHSTKWGTDNLEGATVHFLSGTANPSKMIVLSNTDDTLTFTTSFSAQPTNGDPYRIERYGTWNYNVATDIAEAAHRGLYRQNRYNTAPSNVWPGQLTPGGWGPDTYLDNNDNFRVRRPIDVGPIGGHTTNFFSLLWAERQKRNAAEKPDHGVGDGMSTYVPERLQGFYFDYQYRNDARIGMAVLACKEPGGTDWQDVLTRSTLQNSKNTTISEAYVNLNAYENPTRLGFFVVPYDGVEIPNAYTDDGIVSSRNSTSVTDTDSVPDQDWPTNHWRNGAATFESSSTADPKKMTIGSNDDDTINFTKAFDSTAASAGLPTVGDLFTISRTILPTEQVQIRSNDTWILYLDLSSFGGLTDSRYVVGSEVAIYDEQVVLRLGGGYATEVSPRYHVLSVGGEGHWLHLKTADGEYIRIVTDPESDDAFAAVYNSSDVFQYRAAWAVRAYTYEFNIDGEETALVSGEVMPLDVFRPMIDNYTFATDLSGWEVSSATVGVTVAWSRDAGTFVDSAGSLKGVISAAPAGPWSASYKITHAASPEILAGEMYEAGVWVRTTDTDVQAELSIGLNGVSGAPVVQASISTFTFPAIDTWYPIGVGAIAPGDTGTIEDIYLTIRGVGAAALGTVYFDLVTPGAPNLYISEDAMGTQLVTVRWREGFYG